MLNYWFDITDLLKSSGEMNDMLGVTNDYIVLGARGLNKLLVLFALIWSCLSDVFFKKNIKYLQSIFEMF